MLVRFLAGLYVCVFFSFSSFSEVGSSSGGNFSNQEGEQASKELVAARRLKESQLFGDKALILFQQKFKMVGGQPSVWTITNYPVPSNSSGMSQTPRVSVNGLFQGATPALRTVLERQRNAEPEPKTLPSPTALTYDVSGMGGVGASPTSATEVQMAYLAVDSNFPGDFLSNTNSQVTSADMVAVPVRFLAFVADPTRPNLVKSIRVQVGNITAVVPIDPPPSPTPPCILTPSVPNTVTIAPGTPVTFSLREQSIISSATINGTSVSVPTTQTTADLDREVGSRTLNAPGIEGLQNIRQVPCTDPTDPNDAIGTWVVPASAVGPINNGAVTCNAEVQVRIRRPLAPDCTLILNPNSAEPGDSSQAILKCKNPVTTATIQGQQVTFDVAPNYCDPPRDSRAVTITKSPSSQADEVIHAFAEGIGGRDDDFETLRFLRPAPPYCTLVPAYNRPNNAVGVDLCNPVAQLHLTAFNRVDSASIGQEQNITLTSVEPLPNEPRKKFIASRTVQKSISQSPDRVCAQVSNNWNPSLPGTCCADIVADRTPPTCSLTTSPQNTASSIKLKSVSRSVGGELCLENKSLADKSPFSLEHCVLSTSFRLENVPQAQQGQNSNLAIYRIKNVANDLCLGVADSSRENGAKIQQQVCDSGKSHQEFYLNPFGNSSYRLIPQISNKCVEESGINIIQQDCKNTENLSQQWQIISPSQLKPGDRVDITVNNISCPQQSALTIQGTRVPILNGTASTTVTVSSTSTETISAEVTAPGDLKNTCSNPILGVPPPQATLTAQNTCLNPGAGTVFTLNCAAGGPATDAYIAGLKTPLTGGVASRSVTKNGCSEETVWGVCVGPGGQATATAPLPICAEPPQCTFTTDTNSPVRNQPLNLVLNCDPNRVTEGKIENTPVTFDANGRASIRFIPRDFESVGLRAEVENTSCQSRTFKQTVRVPLNTCKWNTRSPASNTGVSVSVPGNAQDWVDTGIDVYPDSPVTITASGTVNTWPGGVGNWIRTPDGWNMKQFFFLATRADENSIDVNLNSSSLIGKIGSLGKPFFVGTTKMNVGAGEEGRLYLGINETPAAARDNTGVFTAIITGEYYREKLKPANGFENFLYDTTDGRTYIEKNVNVPGNALDWTDSGITVSDSSFVSIISATGEIDINGSATGGKVGINGVTCTDTDCNCRNEPAFNRGALLVRIGGALSKARKLVPGQEFPVTTGGKLYLSANNHNCKSTAGPQFFRVTVGVQPSLTKFYSKSVGGTAPEVLAKRKTINVPANEGWTDTGIDLSIHELIYFMATGTTDVNGAVTGGTASPDGVSLSSSTNLPPLRTANRGALIGKIHTLGAPFLIGTGRPWAAYSQLAAGQTRLYLGINENSSALTDNTGNFTVTIRVYEPNWTDTGVDIESNSLLTFFSEGTLIGKVGINGDAFLIGKTKLNYPVGSVSPGDNNLYLRVNDISPSNNSGTFTTTFYVTTQNSVRRYKNLNSRTNPGEEDFSTIRFTDWANNFATGDFKRDPFGDYDLNAILLKNFDDSYDVWASQSQLAYQIPTRRLFVTQKGWLNEGFTTRCSGTSPTSICFNTIEATTTVNAYPLGDWIVEAQDPDLPFLANCQIGLSGHMEDNCKTLYTLHRGDAWGFQVGPKDSPNCEVQKMYIRETGCFTGDTQIQMANGKRKKISDLRENELVWNPHFQTGVRLKKIVKGPEKKPLYQVRVGAQSITVTEDHPFLTEKGWVQTQALKKGQSLFGYGEGKTVSEVKKLKYTGPKDVYNFELDTEEPLGHVIIANGIPTGDLTTQIQIKKGPQAIP